MDLITWATTYIKHRDILRQRIALLEAKDATIHVKNKDKSAHDYLIQETLKPTTAKTDFIHLICPNTEENFNTLVQHWKDFAAQQNLTLYFVNPNSSTETKWIIKPWLHNKISDPESLETGLRALFETVDVVE